MNSGIRFTLLFVSFAVASLMAAWASAGDCCCTHCGCKKVKKVTRLVTTYEKVETPVYECAMVNSFLPRKGAVSHTSYRCDKYYKLHSQWCCEKHCKRHESCEETTHLVDKNPGDSECECHSESHHETHLDYSLTARYRRYVTCDKEQGCKTLLGASPCGCTKQVCTKQATGEVCTRMVPVVRWVTYHACPECDRNWSSKSSK